MINKRISFLVLIICISCQQDHSFEQIDFKSTVYMINAEIDYYLKATKDGGTWAIKYNLVNEHEKALKALDIEREEVASIAQDSVDRSFRSFVTSDARPYILDKARSHEIILFNEAHYFPYHFHFFKTFLRDLSKLDYKYLALEGLGKGNQTSIKTLNEFNNRYLTIDPVYAEMMREALACGYEIFNYDEDSGGEREKKGAQNIANFVRGKKGKTLVLCGYDHIKETETKTYWEFALAGRIKEVMNTDPLTINQTYFIERSERRFEDQLYQHIIPEVSQVYLDSKGQSFKDPKEPSWYDIMIFHPRTRFTSGKADWFIEGKEKLELDLSSLDLKYPTKVFAYSTDQTFEQSTPYDVSEINGADEKVNLYLPKGKYHIIVHNATGSYRQSITVD